MTEQVNFSLYGCEGWLPAACPLNGSCEGWLSAARALNGSCEGWLHPADERLYLVADWCLRWGLGWVDSCSLDCSSWAAGNITAPVGKDSGGRHRGFSCEGRFKPPVNDNFQFVCCQCRTVQSRY